MIFSRGAHSDGLGVRKHDARAVGDVARFVVEYFIPRIEYSAKCDVQSLRDADRNEHICLWVVTDAKVFFYVGADLAAQTDQSEIIGITSLTLFESENSGLTDVPRRNEVRLTDTQ